MSSSLKQWSCWDNYRACWTGSRKHIPPFFPHTLWGEGGFLLLGQLVVTPGGRGKAAAGRLYGLNVLRAETNPEGLWGERRLRRAGRALYRGGAVRVLAPALLLPRLAGFGLRLVDPEGFVRAQAVPLALAALERKGVPPGQATVALRGMRADRDMVRAAQALCPQVRRLIIDTPRGGEELAAWLRREFGVPILPPGEGCHAALRFHPDCPRGEGEALELYGPRPQLAGLTLSVPRLAEGDREDLPLLAALWEGGRLAPEDIKIT